MDWRWAASESGEDGAAGGGDGLAVIAGEQWWCDGVGYGVTGRDTLPTPSTVPIGTQLRPLPPIPTPGHCLTMNSSSYPHATTSHTTPNRHVAVTGYVTGSRRRHLPRQGAGGRLPSRLRCHGSLEWRLPPLQPPSPTTAFHHNPLPHNHIRNSRIPNGSPLTSVLGPHSHHHVSPRVPTTSNL